MKAATQRLRLAAFEPIVAATTADELSLALGAVCARLGFAYFVTAALVLEGGDRPNARLQDNLPAQHRHRALSLIAPDHPLVKHMNQRVTPIVFDESAYRDPGVPDRWHALKELGIRWGVATAVHLPRGRHLYLVLASTLRRGEAGRLQGVALASLLSSYLAGPAFRLLFSLEEVLRGESPPRPRPSAGAPTDDALTEEQRRDLRNRLTSREAEALHWMAKGKTYWELGQILDISEHTARIHIRNARAKLGTSSNAQTAMLALKLGLLS